MSTLRSTSFSRTPCNSKEDRLRAQLAFIEAKRLFLPDKAPWLPDFERELLTFPRCKDMDQVDALSAQDDMACYTEPAFQEVITADRYDDYSLSDDPRKQRKFGDWYGRSQCDDGLDDMFKNPFDD